MLTRDLWFALSPKEKHAEVITTLNQLHTIDAGTHSLSNDREQGRLPGVRKDLETYLLNVAEWQSNKQLEMNKL